MFDFRYAVASAMAFLAVAFFMFVALPKPAFSQCIQWHHFTANAKRVAEKKDYTLKIYHHEFGGDAIQGAVYLWRPKYGVLAAYYSKKGCLIRRETLRLGTQTNQI
ncbi:MAG: hypothetical protein AAGM67_18270, partial [Bacteroidota bacterium]